MVGHEQAAPKPKKRATGIPRTFLNLGAPAAPPAEDPAGEAGAGWGSQVTRAAKAFQALVRSGGGQSLSAAARRHDLGYALKLTATALPQHLACGLCAGIVRSAMLMPWDAEGRPTCESCIRDGLARNGFTCPLTGTEGVSPDDLFPNVCLRVMEKMDAIERQIEAEEEEEEARKRQADTQLKKGSKNEFEDSGDGIITGRKSKSLSRQKQTNEDDLLFGGDDDSGGDVFDVAGDNGPEEADGDTTRDGNNDATILESQATAPGIDDNTKATRRKPILFAPSTRAPIVSRRVLLKPALADIRR